MPINHEKVAAMDNKFGIADLNANHKITNMLGYELVEEKVLPAGTTTCTFNNLDSDEDLEYFIELDIVLIPVSSSSFLYVRPNNVSSGYRGNRMSSYSGTTSAGVANVTDGFLMTFNPVVETSYVHGTGVLTCLPGQYKFMHAEDTVHGSTRSGGGIMNVVLPSADGFDNLVILCTTGSFSGTIRLWKKIPLSG